MPNSAMALLMGQSLGWTFVLFLRFVVFSQSDMDKKTKGYFALILTFNFLLNFASLLFYSQTEGDSITWFGALFPTPHNYTRLSIFGIASHDWLLIALFKFCISIIVALILAVFVYFLNSELLEHYKVTRGKTWALRLTLGFMIVMLIAAAIGCYQFVAERPG